jgi:penicillin amidase/acyl-homoserine-lactone acylase
MRVILRVLALLGVALAATLVYAVIPERFEVDPAPYVEKASAYDVTIHRDRYGVPHLYGKRDRDVAFGVAYAHAEDDFGTIQEVILAVRGRLASLKGPEAAKTDFLVGWFRVWDVTERAWREDLGEESRAIADAYADGINLYAARHPEELASGDLLPVRGQDVVAGIVFKIPFFYMLDRTLIELFGDERRRPVVTEPIGSNGFALAPRRTSDGRTRLVINSHQPLTGPVAWYEARLHSEEGLDIAGGLFPGSPLILHGHNRHLGWASTVNRPDLSDVYALDVDPEDPMRYRLDGEWKAFDVRKVYIPVRLIGRLRWTFIEDAYASVHGPVARTKHGTYAVRYAGMGEGRQLEQYRRMNRAQTFEEWRDAMRMLALPSINFVYADREGHVGMFHNAKLPIRKEGWDWSSYVRGDRSELIWTEHVPFDDLPHTIDPPSGFVFSVNHTPFRATDGPGSPDPAKFSKTLGLETELNNRAQRALALFGSDPSITREELERYKYDKIYAQDSEVMLAVEEVLAEKSADPIVVEAQRVLASWDRSTDLESTGAAIGTLGVAKVIEARRWKPDPPDLVENFAEQARRLHAAYGRIDVPWREVSRHRRGSFDRPVAGGPDVLRAAHYGDIDEQGKATDERGDSYIMFVEWARDGTVTSSSVHPYGAATSREGSPHYVDQAELFATERLRKVWLEEAELMQNLERSYRP